MFDQAVQINIVVTAALIAFVAAFRAVLGVVLQRKLKQLTGYQLLANAITSVLIIGVGIYLLYVWRVIQPIVESLVAFSAIAAVLLLAVKDIWIENLLAGVSMIGDKNIKVGTDVEVKGKAGKITEMTLTVTKIKTRDGHTVIVPNKLFREEAFTIKKYAKL